MAPVVLALAALVGSADEPLLPTRLGASQRVNWNQAGAAELERLAGEQAPLLREYGSRAAEQGVYRGPRGEWQVTVHTMEDRSAAYGAFTLLRAGSEPVTLGEAGARQSNRWLFYQGNFLVLADGAVERDSLRTLGLLLEERSRGQASLPTLPRYLPREGFAAGSDRYLLGPLALAEAAFLAPGDWVGFAYGAEAEAARYHLGGQEATLLLLSYPTPQIAHARLQDFFRLFNLNGAGAPAGRLAFAKRKGTLVVFVAGLDSRAAADRLMQQVSYEPQLSWSEPANPYSESQLLPSLVNIFLGTGLILLVTFLGGLAFAAFRLGVTYWLPGKVFNRPGHGDFILLDLHERK